jgi:SAM-dependent methyltransferase
LSSYIGRHAELYDLFYSDKPYADETRFIHSLLQKYHNNPVNRILELACGTGSHAIILNKLGYEIVATDYSEDMLKSARLKAEKNNVDIDFQLQDMRGLPEYQPHFDAAICLFDSIGYAATNDAILDVLNGVHRNLNDDGLFIIEFWHAGAMLSKYDPLRVRSWVIPDGEVIRISRTTLDCAKQLAFVKYQIYEHNNNGTYSYIHEEQVNRYFLLQEMSMLLKCSHFNPIKWFSGYSENESITDDTWHVVVVAQRMK